MGPPQPSGHSPVREAVGAGVRAEGLLRAALAKFRAQVRRKHSLRKQEPSKKFDLLGV